MEKRDLSYETPSLEFADLEIESFFAASGGGENPGEDSTEDWE